MERTLENDFPKCAPVHRPQGSIGLGLGGPMNAGDWGTRIFYDDDDDDEDDDDDDKDDYICKSVNFKVRISKFCMEIDLDNI